MKIVRVAFAPALAMGLACTAMAEESVAPEAAPGPALRAAADEGGTMLAEAAPARAEFPVSRPTARARGRAEAEPNVLRPTAFRPQAEPLRPSSLPPSRPVGAEARGLCADWRLEGEVVDPIEGPGRCGIPLPVMVRRVAGVALEPPAPMNCRTARALAVWVEKGPKRSAPRELGGARLDAVLTSGTYACRTRNHMMGGRLSEHAVGNAIDVHAFRLSDGRIVGLKGDWRRGAAGAFLLASWRAACGPFGTVLGPDHDAPHEDHFHFDTASRTRGPYCR